MSDPIDDRRERLRSDLKDAAYREQYATSALIENVSAQVQALRRQRGMTQEDLAGLIGTKQPRISYIETPPDGDKPPNWEVDTLNRIAHALGTRLRISFETYGSLLEERDLLSPDSLRRVDVQNDPILFPLPPMPAPNPHAPERTQWMQEMMIPWLWEEKLDIGRLIDWLQGRGLPPVGHDEEPYQWLLQGVSVPGKVRDRLEKRLAERLAVLLGEQPDVHPLVRDRVNEFLINLYWACAGLSQPSFLAEELWRTYKRLKDTGLPGAVRDALQGALVHNQFGETKPLAEIWKPMVERGRHRWLRGGDLIGYEGILVRQRTFNTGLEEVLSALTAISHRWTGTPEQSIDFRHLIYKVSGLDKPGTIGQIHSAARSWSKWARALLPLFEVSTKEQLRVEIRFEERSFYAVWNVGKGASAEIIESRSLARRQFDSSEMSGTPQPRILTNFLLTSIGNYKSADPAEAVDAAIAHKLALSEVRAMR